MILKHENFVNSQKFELCGITSCQQNIQVTKMKSRTNKVITCFVLFTYMQSFTIVLTWAVNFHAVKVILESTFRKIKLHFDVNFLKMEWTELHDLNLCEEGLVVKHTWTHPYPS